LVDAGGLVLIADQPAATAAGSDFTQPDLKAAA
jgi:hypothetical protein